MGETLIILGFVAWVTIGYLGLQTCVYLSNGEWFNGKRAYTVSELIFELMLGMVLGVVMLIILLVLFFAVSDFMEKFWKFDVKKTKEKVMPTVRTIMARFGM